MADVQDVRQMFDSAYIGAWDLQGKDATVTIARVVAGELAKAGTSKKDKAPIMYFEGKDKGMVLNKTNMRIIASLYGGFKVKQWIGKPITLFATTCQFGPNTVDCIRVKNQLPSGAARQPGEEG